MQSHFLNQSWLIINWTLQHIQWNSNQSTNIIFQENIFENICYPFDVFIFMSIHCFVWVDPIVLSFFSFCALCFPGSSSVHISACTTSHKQSTMSLFSSSAAHAMRFASPQGAWCSLMNSYRACAVPSHVRRNSGSASWMPWPLAIFRWECEGRQCWRACRVVGRSGELMYATAFKDKILEKLHSQGYLSPERAIKKDYCF